MTRPQIDLSGIIPTKWKPWVGVIGAALAYVIPWVTQAAAGLPQPWPTVIALVILVLTWLGIYKVPYAPKGTVLVPETVIAHDGGAEVQLPPTAYQHPTTGTRWENPWPRR
ncbi:hypothetical protein BCA37_10850 [Mycobacterium sp. djl-10]|nr:hypothetical protein BCA37_10850 [Mycobacterium sp. djl-10]